VHPKLNELDGRPLSPAARKRISKEEEMQIQEMQFLMDDEEAT